MTAEGESKFEQQVGYYGLQLSGTSTPVVKAYQRVTLLLGLAISRQSSAFCQSA